MALLNQTKTVFPGSCITKIKKKDLTLILGAFETTYKNIESGFTFAPSLETSSNAFQLFKISIMTQKARDSLFFSLPIEIRDMIYEHLLPNEGDISAYTCIKYNGNYSIRRKDGKCFGDFFRPRQDGSPCYPAILRVNRQIYIEASRILYARTYTITVSARLIHFLNRYYNRRELIHDNKRCFDVGYNLNFREWFPISFPFDRISALRIRIHAPVWHGLRDLHLKWSYPWSILYNQLEELSYALYIIRNQGRTLKKLIIDAWEPCVFHGPLDGEDPVAADVRRMLDTIRYSVGNVESCEIRIGSWTKICPETIGIAKDCGRAIVSWCSLNGDSTGVPLISRNFSALYSKKPVKLSPRNALYVKDGIDSEHVFDDWHLAYTRL